MSQVRVVVALFFLISRPTTDAVSRLRRAARERVLDRSSVARVTRPAGAPPTEYRRVYTINL